MPLSETQRHEGGVALYRHAGLPSVELIVQRKAQCLSFCSTDFALLVPAEWVGTVTYKSQSHRLAAGHVLLVEPEEVVATSSLERQGGLRVLLVGCELLRAKLATRRGSNARAESAPGSLRVSDALAAQLARAFAALEAEGASLDAALSVDALLSALVEEAFQRGVEPPAHAARTPDRRGRMIERLRETLVRGARVDEPRASLETLSSELGLSRFQALRLFRQHYGITPHAYQLHLRVALARRSLRAGGSLAEVAVSCGFVDQSHFTKQFKRLMGITPGQYARPRRPSA